MSESTALSFYLIYREEFDRNIYRKRRLKKKCFGSSLPFSPFRLFRAFSPVREEITSRNRFSNLTHTSIRRLLIADAVQVVLLVRAAQRLLTLG